MVEREGMLSQRLRIIRTDVAFLGVARERSTWVDVRRSKTSLLELSNVLLKQFYITSLA